MMDFYGKGNIQTILVERDMQCPETKASSMMVTRKMASLRVSKLISKFVLLKLGANMIRYLSKIEIELECLFALS